jgi:hypothetical protein
MSRVFALTLIVLLTAHGGAAHAQSAFAMVSGRVIDGAGGAVAGVAVTLVDAAHGTQREAITNARGRFIFIAVLPGRYTVLVDHPAFAPAAMRDLDLDPGVQTALTVTLQVAGVRETIAVRGEASTHAGSASSVGVVFDRRAIERLALNGSSVQAALGMMPGIAIAASAVNGTGDLSVNGQRPGANYFTADGVGANIANSVSARSRPGQASGGALPGLTTLGTTASLAPLDALEAVRVQTSSYAAEYGRQPGAQVSLVTRAGGSTFRGTLFEHVRDDAMNANDWFANRAGLRQLPMAQQQFGVTLGGPLRAGAGAGAGASTTFMLSHERLHLRNPAMWITQVPTIDLRQQAHPSVQPYLDAFPLPNGRAIVDGLAEAVGTDDAESRVDSTSVRVDHRVGDALSLFGRINIAPSSNRAWLPQNLAIRREERLRPMTSTVAVTQTARRIVVDLRANVSTHDGEIRAEQTEHLGARPVPRARLIPPEFDDGTASAMVAFPFDARLATSSATSIVLAPESSAQRQINVVGSATALMQRHQVKVGVDYRRLTPQLSRASYELSLGFRTADYMRSGDIAWETVSARPSTVWPEFTNLSVFAQDTWVPSARVTVDVGVRWELNPPPGERHGRMPYTVGAAVSPFDVAPAGTPLWRTRYDNIAPRGGIAVMLTQTPGRELMVRGGGGIYYDLGSTQATRGYDAYGYRETRNLLGAPGAGAGAGASVNEPVFGFDPHLRTPRTTQWNVSIDQALGATRSVTMAYVGAAGRRLLAQETFGDPVTFDQAEFALTTNDGRSDYHALQWQFQQRMWHGLRASFAHTWSHATDLTSVESRAEAATILVKADADFDVRHVVNATIGYDLPAPARAPWRAGALLRHWSLDGRVIAQTGRPLSVNARTYYDGLGREVMIWPRRIDGVPLYINDPMTPGGRRVNPAAFATGGLVGQIPTRNVARTSPMWQVDLALHRTFALVRTMTLQTRVSAFNVLNHPNFGAIDSELRDDTFGAPRAMLNRSLGGINPAYQIGGPRTLELALRLSF